MQGASFPPSAPVVAAGPAAGLPLAGGTGETPAADAFAALLESLSGPALTTLPAADTSAADTNAARAEPAGAHEELEPDASWLTAWPEAALPQLAVPQLAVPQPAPARAGSAPAGSQPATTDAVAAGATGATGIGLEAASLAAAVAAAPGQGPATGNPAASAPVTAGAVALAGDAPGATEAAPTLRLAPAGSRAPTPLMPADSRGAVAIEKFSQSSTAQETGQVAASAAAQQQFTTVAAQPQLTAPAIEVSAAPAGANPPSGAAWEASAVALAGSAPLRAPDATQSAGQELGPVAAGPARQPQLTAAAEASLAPAGATPPPGAPVAAGTDALADVSFHAADARATDRPAPAPSSAPAAPMRAETGAGAAAGNVLPSESTGQVTAPVAVEPAAQPPLVAPAAESSTAPSEAISPSGVPAGTTQHAGTLQYAGFATSPAAPNTAPVHQAALPSQPLDAAFAGDLTAEVRLMAASGVQRAELRLNPADLGPIHIHLSVNAQTADISFAASHGATRDGITQALPALREMLAGQGLSLGQAGVSSQHPGHPSGDGRRLSGYASPRVEGSAASLLATPLAGTVGRGRGMLDLFA